MDEFIHVVAHGALAAIHEFADLFVGVSLTEEGEEALLAGGEFRRGGMAAGFFGGFKGFVIDAPPDEGEVFSFRSPDPRGGEVHVDEEEAALFFRVDEGSPVFETAPFFGYPEAGGDFRGVFFGENALHFKGGDGAGLPGFLHGGAAVPCEEGLAVVEEFFFARSDPAEVDRIGSGEEVFHGQSFFKESPEEGLRPFKQFFFFHGFLTSPVICVICVQYIL